MDFARCSEDLRQKLIVVKERKCKFVLENPNGTLVRRVKVDGCLIVDERPRCDYLFEIGEPMTTARYVELKGHDIEKAVKQLAATLGYIKPRHDDLKRVCHVVAHRVPSGGTDVQQLKVKFARAHKVPLEIDTGESRATV